MPTDEDEPPEWESWMVAREPVHLFQQQVEAAERRARLAREVMAVHRAKELCRKAAERTWLAIQESLRKR